MKMNTGIKEIFRKMYFPEQTGRFMRLVFSILFYFFIVNKSLAREVWHKTDSLKVIRIRHEMGVGFGTSLQTGISYRVWRGTFGIHLMALGYKLVKEEQYIWSFTFLHSLVRNDISNLFLYQANRYRSLTDFRASGRYIRGGYVYSSAQTVDWANTIGLGYEIFSRTGKRNPVGITFMTGWGFYQTFRRANLSAELTVMYKLGKR